MPTSSSSSSTVGRLISTADLNVYIFKGRHTEYRDFATTLNARPETVSFEDLHALLLNHEYVHGCPNVDAISPMAHLTSTQLQLLTA
ncbi:uncharacterized protein A4U43_C02F13690 [Asparagus officinalis]|uniref:Uncharacterized protein n=1 Tax=Asparagus officinalis TaxID=4686 RepID=A0A5P1FI89_ASPOF|nr:uncharacterized protein A4U43_C02F13690 [Asparagus officinalis]